MQEGSFSLAIEEHLALKTRNGRLERAMPISRYREMVTAEETDESLASRSVAADVADDEPPTETLVLRPRLWDDPDSWWDAGDPGVGWAT